MTRRTFVFCCFCGGDASFHLFYYEKLVLAIICGNVVRSTSHIPTEKEKVIPPLLYLLNSLHQKKIINHGSTVQYVLQCILSSHSPMRKPTNFLPVLISVLLCDMNYSPFYCSDKCEYTKPYIHRLN